MRDAFVRALTDIIRTDPNSFLVTADLGFGIFSEFSKSFPKQFINVGVAEQQLIGFSVGMALEGKTVFAYSIGNFPTFRCLEQIRNDACYHRANIKIVTSGGGLSYGALGFSHHATEDIAILRALTDITIVAPGDPIEADLATKSVYQRQGVCYLRLGRNGETNVHSSKFRFEIGKALKLFEGEDILLLSTGGMLKHVWDAREKLVSLGLSVGLYSMHTVKPIDVTSVKEAANRYRVLISVEEHSVIGGLGGSIAEILAEIPNPKAVLKRVGIPENHAKIVGDQEYLRRFYGLSVEAIVEVAKQTLETTAKVGV